MYIPLGFRKCTHSDKNVYDNLCLSLESSIFSIFTQNKTMWLWA